jgi:hypothetical protein
MKMIGFRRLVPLLVAILSLGSFGFASAGSAPSNGSTKLNWKTLTVLSSHVVPNYATGYGPVAPIGAPTPTPGTLSSPGAGYVDFGGVVSGYNYLYRDAAQIHVTSNDASGFTVYAEGATDFVNGASTMPIAGTLFWLLTNAANTPYSPATSFEKTTFPVTGTGATTGINYGGSAPPATATVWSYGSTTIGQPSNEVVQGYDYELRLPSTAPNAAMSLYVVYTVTAN